MDRTARYHRWEVRSFPGKRNRCFMSGSCHCRPDYDFAHRPLYRVGSSLSAVRAARRPHPVHQTTAILLTLLTGVLLWANLRNSGWQEVWNEARSLRGWTQSQRPCFIAVGLSPPSWSASLTVCDSIPAVLKDVSWSSTGSSFWSPSTPRRPLASDFYGGVVTVTSEVWTSGYRRLRLSGQEVQ